MGSQSLLWNQKERDRGRMNITTYQEEDQHWEDGRALLRLGPVPGY